METTDLKAEVVRLDRERRLLSYQLQAVTDCRAHMQAEIERRILSERGQQDLF